MAEGQLEKLDVKNLRLEDLDNLDHDALKEALKSVLRSPTASLQHQDHRSHSSSSGDIRVVDIAPSGEKVLETAAHEGQAMIRTTVAPLKKSAPPIQKTAPPVNK